jgi:hypothetical protein
LIKPKVGEFLATKEEYAQAIARVRAGTASSRDLYLTEKMSRNAGGGLASQAREALAKSGKGKSGGFF